MANYFGVNTTEINKEWISANKVKRLEILKTVQVPNQQVVKPLEIELEPIEYFNPRVRVRPKKQKNKPPVVEILVDKDQSKKPVKVEVDEEREPSPLYGFVYPKCTLIK